VALGIITLLIGVPIGLYLLLRPKKIWWTQTRRATAPIGQMLSATS
jgi:hypothetical protein